MYAKSQTTIANILDAAQQLFVTHTYDDISMVDIATAAGMTKGAIYHHFKGKQELFIQMMLRYLTELQGALQAAVDANGSARERLHLLTEIFLNKSQDEQRVVQLVRRDSSRFLGKERDLLLQAYQSALPNQIECIISDGVKSEEIIAEDVRLLTWQFVAIVEVSLSDYARQRFDSPEKMATHLTKLFFDGVRRS